jgi:hypothetical protein
MVVGFINTYMQSVPIATKVVSSNPVHGEVYSIQHYVIKFVSDLRQVGEILRFSANKTDCHDITEILLKVTLNAIHQPTMITFPRHVHYNKKKINEQIGIFFRLLNSKLC